MLNIKIAAIRQLCLNLEIPVLETEESIEKKILQVRSGQAKNLPSSQETDYEIKLPRICRKRTVQIVSSSEDDSEPQAKKLFIAKKSNQGTKKSITSSVEVACIDQLTTRVPEPSNKHDDEPSSAETNESSAGIKPQISVMAMEELIGDTENITFFLNNCYERFREADIQEKIQHISDCLSKIISLHQQLRLATAFSVKQGLEASKKMICIEVIQSMECVITEFPSAELSRVLTGVTFLRVFEKFRMKTREFKFKTGLFKNCTNLLLHCLKRGTFTNSPLVTSHLMDKHFGHYCFKLIKEIEKFTADTGRDETGASDAVVSNANRNDSDVSKTNDKGDTSGNGDTTTVGNADASKAGTNEPGVGDTNETAKTVAVPAVSETESNKTDTNESNNSVITETELCESSTKDILAQEKTNAGSGEDDNRENISGNSVTNSTSGNATNQSSPDKTSHVVDGNTNSSFSIANETTPTLASDIIDHINQIEEEDDEIEIISEQRRQPVQEKSPSARDQFTISLQYPCILCTDDMGLVKFHDTGRDICSTNLKAHLYLPLTNQFDAILACFPLVDSRLMLSTSRNNELILLKIFIVNLLRYYRSWMWHVVDTKVKGTIETHFSFLNELSVERVEALPDRETDMSEADKTLVKFMKTIQYRVKKNHFRYSTQKLYQVTEGSLRHEILKEVSQELLKDYCLQKHYNPYVANNCRVAQKKESPRVEETLSKVSLYRLITSVNILLAFTRAGSLRQAILKEHDARILGFFRMFDISLQCEKVMGHSMETYEENKRMEPLAMHLATTLNADDMEKAKKDKVNFAWYCSPSNTLQSTTIASSASSIPKKSLSRGSMPQLIPLPNAHQKKPQDPNPLHNRTSNPSSTVSAKVDGKLSYHKNAVESTASSSVRNLPGNSTNASASHRHMPPLASFPHVNRSSNAGSSASDLEGNTNTSTFSSYQRNSNTSTPSYQGTTPKSNPNSSAPNYQSSTPSYQGTTNNSAPHYQSSTPSYQGTTNSSAPHYQSSTPSYQGTTNSSAPHYQSSTPSYQGTTNSSAPHYQSSTPSYQGTTNSSAPHYQSSTPSYQVTTNSSAPNYQSSTPGYQGNTNRSSPNYQSSTQGYQGSPSSYASYQEDAVVSTPGSTHPRVLVVRPTIPPRNTPVSNALPPVSNANKIVMPRLPQVGSIVRVPGYVVQQSQRISTLPPRDDGGFAFQDAGDAAQTSRKPPTSFPSHYHMSTTPSTLDPTLDQQQPVQKSRRGKGVARGRRGPRGASRGRGETRGSRGRGIRLVDQSRLFDTNLLGALENEPQQRPSGYNNAYTDRGSEPVFSGSTLLEGSPMYGQVRRWNGESGDVFLENILEQPSDNPLLTEMSDLVFDGGNLLRDSGMDGSSLMENSGMNSDNFMENSVMGRGHLLGDSGMDGIRIENVLGNTAMDDLGRNCDLRNNEVTFCAQCGALAEMQCSGCNQIFYCTNECQLKHWHLVHSTECSMQG